MNRYKVTGQRWTHLDLLHTSGWSLTVVPDLDKADPRWLVEHDEDSIRMAVVGCRGIGGKGREPHVHIIEGVVLWMDQVLEAASIKAPLSNLG